MGNAKSVCFVCASGHCKHLNDPEGGIRKRWSLDVSGSLCSLHSNKSNVTEGKNGDV